MILTAKIKSIKISLHSSEENALPTLAITHIKLVCEYESLRVLPIYITVSDF